MFTTSVHSPVYICCKLGQLRLVESDIESECQGVISTVKQATGYRSRDLPSIEVTFEECP